MSSIQRTRMLSQFSCLGDRCGDTCCQGWSMQVDDATLERYRKEAPELLGAVEQGGKDDPWIMRKDPKTGYCVKLDGGWCGIHKARGDSFLSDACHFYPRVTRRLGDTVVMTASASCPEIARLGLQESGGLILETAEVDRLPATLKDYLPPELTAEQALAIHQAFLDAVDDTGVSVERAFARIAYASRCLERIPKNNWVEGAPVYLQLADGTLPLPESNPADPFNLLHALAGLIVASHRTIAPRLKQTVDDMEKALCVTLDWRNILIEADDKSTESYLRLKKMWQHETATHYDAMLRRWLKMQLSLALHPFAGLGENVSERVTIIGVRFATFKLALMCACDIHGKILPGDVAVRIAQSLSRFLDHLGDATFSLQIYSETGWVQESRMRGLLEY